MSDMSNYTNNATSELGPSQLAELLESMKATERAQQYAILMDQSQLSFLRTQIPTIQAPIYEDRDDFRIRFGHSFDLGMPIIQTPYPLFAMPADPPLEPEKKLPEPIAYGSSLGLWATIIALAGVLALLTAV